MQRRGLRFRWCSDGTIEASHDDEGGAAAATAAAAAAAAAGSPGRRGFGRVGVRLVGAVQTVGLSVQLDRRQEDGQVRLVRSDHRARQTQRRRSSSRPARQRPVRPRRRRLQLGSFLILYRYRFIPLPSSVDRNAP